MYVHSLLMKRSAACQCSPTLVREQFDPSHEASTEESGVRKTTVTDYIKTKVAI